MRPLTERERMVITARRHARVGRRGIADALASELGVGTECVRRFLDGRTFAWLDHIEPPVRGARPLLLPEEVEGAKKLVAEGVSKRETARRCGIAASSLLRILGEAPCTT